MQAEAEPIIEQQPQQQQLLPQVLESVGICQQVVPGNSLQLCLKQQQQLLPPPQDAERGSPARDPSPAAAVAALEAPTTAATAEVLAVQQQLQQPQAGPQSLATSGLDEDVQLDVEPQQQQQQQQQEEEEETGSSGKGKPAKPRPTHFVALQVSHCPQVRQAIAAVQAGLVAAEPALEACLLEPATAHLTIMVLNLPKQEQLDAAAAALAELGPVLQAQALLAPLQLQLQGLSHFRHQVLYIDFAPGPALDSLMQLAAAATQHLKAAAGGSLAVDEGGRGFTPHVSVAKTSRLIGKRRKGRLPKIPEAAWAAAQQQEAVRCIPVTVTEIQICSMQGRKAGQYYRATHRLKLTAPAAGAAVPAAVVQPPAAAANLQSQTQEGGPAAAAAAMTQPQAKRQHGPLESARKRFKRLLSVLASGGRQEHTKDSSDPC
uniref:A-kinase anchor protein 7-like phosphoesterase domain-containing protein n=1 Tax=Tetradesmus obliquus TaxID=3088 RepID=A0A383VL78_TETOB|eukprot:jgi/Sobl393_1/7926/SZX66287.1